MQLILDTEAAIDIKEKMSTLEDTPVKDVDILKTDIENKEDAACKEMLSKHKDDQINVNGTNTETVLPSDLLPEESTDGGAQHELSDTINNEKHIENIENGDVHLENFNKLSENIDEPLENDEESKVNQNNTHDKDEDIICEKEALRHIESNQCNDILHTNGNDTENVDKIIKDDDVESSTSDMDKSDSISNIETEKKLISDTIDSNLRKQNDGGALEKDTANEVSKTVIAVNKDLETDNKSNDTESNMEVDDDVAKIADYIQETCENLTNIESPSTFTDEVENNEASLLTDSKETVKEPSSKQTQDTPTSVLEDSLRTEKGSINTETCHSAPIEKDLNKIDDNALCEPKSQEYKEVEAMDCDEPENNLEVNEVKANEVKEIPESNLDVEVAKEKEVTDEHINNLDLEIKENEVTLESDSNLHVKAVVEKNVIDEPKSNFDVEQVTEKEDTLPEETVSFQGKPKEPKKIISKLSNTLDILSDDEEMMVDDNQNKPAPIIPDKQCISIEDDDDIMLIDEEITSKDSKQELANKPEKEEEKKVEEKCSETTYDLEPKTIHSESCKTLEAEPKEEETSENKIESSNNSETNVPREDCKPEPVEKPIPEKPLLPENFLKSYKKNLTDMTREELEEFCILKIVESIVDRSNLSEIKSKLKAMAQNIDEYKKKAMMLSKQNRDLQVVLRSVQEEQKKKPDTAVTPLKITRSVGMQVIMQEKSGMRKKTSVVNTNNSPNVRNVRTPNQNPRPQKPTAASSSQQIPVPRLVPANAPVSKPVTPQSANLNNQAKTPSPGPNGIRPQNQKVAEKRPFSRVQSVTVDLTDDEQPTKIPNRTVPMPPVRLVSPQSLLAPQRQPFGQSLSSPRKVYIPISGPQNQNIRPGQTIMLKSMPAARQRCPTPQVTRMPQNTVRISRVQNRHPAPLPDAMKQYQPPNWKALPPAPDLKLSKVENGIVISWKIEGYQEDSYEEIASYQLYAYQETSSPPSTALWKKIGDVKALPLPMACTLTQFMAGFKYYFAVRAVDVKSRVGPFSLPGSILLLNKM